MKRKKKHRRTPCPSAKKALATRARNARAAERRECALLRLECVASIVEQRIK